MKIQKQLSSIMTAVLLCGPVSPFLGAQRTAAAGAATLPAASAPATTATLLISSTPLSEEELRARFVGKLIFLRGSYLGDDINFDKEGKVIGSPAVASFTLSAFEVRKVTLSKNKLDLEADRYGLHYLGALAFEGDGNSYDRVKISKKPVHISIEREVIVIPKVKKDKKKKKDEAAAQVAAAQTLKTQNAGAAATTAQAPPTTAAAAETAQALAAVSPAQSAMRMNKALDNIFATSMDPRMMAQLPGYWQEYFTSSQQHHPFMPADGNIKVLSEGMMPPKVLNRIDPSSNEFAQQYGIAGMEMVRTVVDATGVPRQMAISRPIGFGLDEKAVEAVRNSHFQPALVNGKPVPVIIDLVVTFRIYSNRTKPGSVSTDAKDTVLAASVGDSDAAKAPTSPQ